MAYGHACDFESGHRAEVAIDTALDCLIAFCLNPQLPLANPPRPSLPSRHDKERFLRLAGLLAFGLRARR